MVHSAWGGDCVFIPYVSINLVIISGEFQCPHLKQQNPSSHFPDSFGKQLVDAPHWPSGRSCAQRFNALAAFPLMALHSGSIHSWPRFRWGCLRRLGGLTHTAAAETKSERNWFGSVDRQVSNGSRHQGMGTPRDSLLRRQGGAKRYLQRSFHAVCDPKEKLPCYTGV